MQLFKHFAPYTMQCPTCLTNTAHTKIFQIEKERTISLETFGQNGGGQDCGSQAFLLHGKYTR